MKSSTESLQTLRLEIPQITLMEQNFGESSEKIKLEYLVSEFNRGCYKLPGIENPAQIQALNTKDPLYLNQLIALTTFPTRVIQFAFTVDGFFKEFYFNPQSASQATSVTRTKDGLSFTTKLPCYTAAMNALPNDGSIDADLNAYISITGTVNNTLQIESKTEVCFLYNNRESEALILPAYQAFKKKLGIKVDDKITVEVPAFDSYIQEKSAPSVRRALFRSLWITVPGSIVVAAAVTAPSIHFFLTEAALAALATAIGSPPVGALLLIAAGALLLSLAVAAIISGIYAEIKTNKELSKMAAAPYLHAVARPKSLRYVTDINAAVAQHKTAGSASDTSPRHTVATSTEDPREDTRSATVSLDDPEDLNRTTLRKR